MGLWDALFLVFWAIFATYTVVIPYLKKKIREEDEGYDGTKRKKEATKPMDLKWAIGAGVLVLILILIISSIQIIGAGERGVVLKFGQVQPYILAEGLHFMTPIQDSVVRVDVKTLKYETEATAASSDLQDAKTTVALNYHLSPESVNNIVQTIGLDYETKLIAPAIQETVKQATSQFTAEQLITKRQSVKDQIDSALRARLEPRGIVVETTSITNFQFSTEFAQAIEAKVTAQQKALQAENDLRRIEIEAQQSVAKAKGDAEAIAIIQQQLKFSPEYIQYLAMQKWNGILPTVTGGAIPLINLPINQQTTGGSVGSGGGGCAIDPVTGKCK